MLVENVYSLLVKEDGVRGVGKNNEVKELSSSGCRDPTGCVPITYSCAW